jgi:hypothetical protein
LHQSNKNLEKYTIEEIYELVGKKDKTAQVRFFPGTKSAQKFGLDVTVVFIYTQAEREQLDEMVKAGSKTSGMVRTKYLVGDLNKDVIRELEQTGINSDDIFEILYFKTDPANTFHSQEIRTIKKTILTISPKPKGGDYNWIYGFKKKLVREGIGMTPNERLLYMALKLYFESNELSDDEKHEIYEDDNATLRPALEWEYLPIKLNRGEASEVELKRLGVLLADRRNRNIELLDKYLQEAGSGFKKLARSNIDQAVSLLMKIEKFKERKFSVTGKFAVFLDIDGFLHIYMRHVLEMKVNAHFEHKDNFQWAIEDVTTVMEHVMLQIDKEVQEHFMNNPGKRYSRYGQKAVYFEGDYYTVHIEPDGRISTFHKNRKKETAEEKAKRKDSEV